MTLISNAILLFFVIDPFGNIPMLLSILKGVPEARHRAVILRETAFGLAILLGFLFGGDSFMRLFHLETEAVTLAGGVILFIIGIRMIFPTHGASLYGDAGEPFMVPIAMPMIAGPSALATLLILSRNEDVGGAELTASLVLAWFAASVLLLLSPLLYRVLGNKGLQALEKLMGMLLLIMSVQMFIDGLRALVARGI